jgi:hypothetical protein
MSHSILDVMSAGANIDRPNCVSVVDRMTHDSDPLALASARGQEESDAELIARARANDEAAFEMLVRRHYRAAFAVSLAHARTRHDAEDICHDALILPAHALTALSVEHL